MGISTTEWGKPVKYFWCYPLATTGAPKIRGVSRANDPLFGRPAAAAAAGHKDVTSALRAADGATVATSRGPHSDAA